MKGQNAIKKVFFLSFKLSCCDNKMSKIVLVFPFRRLNVELELEKVRCGENMHQLNWNNLLKRPSETFDLTRCVTENEKKRIMSI